MTSNLLLLVTAAIWGFGFVAQVLGMNYMEPFAFVGVRFLLGALSLVPVLWFFWHRGHIPDFSTKQLMSASLIVGSVLFLAGGSQQVGIVYSNASNAAFITGLYMVLVPIFGVFLGRKTSANAWVGSGLACVGLYFLSVGESLNIGFGDSLLLVGAVCWAAHILVIDHFTKKVPPLLIALGQFIVCGVMGLIVSSIFESTSWEDTIEAKYILIYAGLITVGVAYTLQVVAQEKAHPTHAAIILSLEAVFGAAGGYAFLNEVLTSREFFGMLLDAARHALFSGVIKGFATVFLLTAFLSHGKKLALVKENTGLAVFLDV